MGRVLSSPPDWTTAIIEGLFSFFIVTRPDQCPEGQKMFVKLPNVPNVAHNLPLGSRLIRFRKLGSLGDWTLGSTNVEGGLHPASLVKPNLTRSPKSSAAMYILTGTYIGSEALHQLMGKDAVEPLQISGLLQPTFLVSKPDSRWRPILDLSNQTIRTSLQQGEWVTSIDFKDTYFHIPIQEQSRKCL